MVVAYFWVFHPSLPAASQGIGHDYAFYLPRLLVGYFHYLRNGFWSIARFSPAQCGGIPLYADPNVPYFSLPQLLSYVQGPVDAVRTTVMVFAVLGAAGAYLLARTRFNLSIAASLAAAMVCSTACSFRAWRSDT